MARLALHLYEVGVHSVFVAHRTFVRLGFHEPEQVAVETKSWRVLAPLASWTASQAQWMSRIGVVPGVVERIHRFQSDDRIFRVAVSAGMVDKAEVLVRRRIDVAGCTVHVRACETGLALGVAGLAVEAISPVATQVDARTAGAV